MAFDLILREARLPLSAATDPLVDIGVAGGRIVAVRPGLEGAAAEVVPARGRLVCAGFVETHIHLDKSCLFNRCACETTRFPHLAMERVSAIKPQITVEDVTARAGRTLEKCVLHGCTRMRTHVEVDPRIGLRFFEGVKALIDAYAWAIDVEICVMPQEGLTNNPGTDELMVAALRNGAKVVGAAPNYDSDRAAQIRRVFEMARDFDVDIDMHLDSGTSGADLDTLLVCDLTEQYGWGGRVAIGHVTKLSTMKPAEVDAVARRLADAGVALTVLPATDLYLGGRHRDADVPRSVVDANRLVEAGVLCSLSSNNIQNPFTPFGDGQLIRQASHYGNIIQRGNAADVQAMWSMITDSSARLLRQDDYGIREGAPADLVMVDATDEVDALRGIAPVLAAFKRGRRTVTREAAVLHRPG
ncbi:amidohydrolase family protein [Falsiroseomonas selenitidurans]|uniref:Amidohydrolase family protein n=1 Tax=Falsiroseomonas selenitidurans TaxID=2716335 RepID=A0ABX1E5B0_9PROT|nr:amidohydrolase family protein [Falsiroseomonas selenitidurans]NKC30983.1 amidohydrolase family protein [Falsiroseomonas selenitidurans]